MSFEFDDRRGDVFVQGGSFADVIASGTGDDTIDAGAGADRMTGGLGNDAYYVDDIGDVVTELVGEGVDTIHASISWTLGANLENLAFAGSANLNGLGNALDNVLTGNDGSNYLKGGDGNDTLVGAGGNDRLQGGAGADSMAGGTGDDVYYVDDADDIVEENADAGADTVHASIDYALTADVERLIGSGSTGLRLTGNDLDNRINGATGDDVLTGGVGKDVLTGGGGADTFVFGGVDDAGDTIADFDAAVDTIGIDLAGFGLTSFDSSMFEANARGVATTADARFIYSETNGRLFFDADGSGAGRAVLLATLRGVPEVTAESFTTADLLV